jgi:hypothetical protein
MGRVNAILVVLGFGLGASGFLASCDEDSGATDDTVEVADGAVEADDDAVDAADGTVEADDPIAGEVETRIWINERSRLSGDRLANFVPFTFEYPADWRILEDGTGQSPNFVKVETLTADQVTIENFAVGWYSGVSADRIIDMLEPQFSQAFPNYQRLFADSHRVDGILSPGFTFQATAETPRGPMTFWGRAMAVPVAETGGLILVMFAGEGAPGVESAADVGEVGNLAAILDSFDVQE